MTLTETVRRFQHASRELRNTYFHPPEWEADAWDVLEQFRIAERSLFACLMSLQCEKELVEYGTPQHQIATVPHLGTSDVPVMFNRIVGVSHGYWDHPINTLSRQVQFRFVRFFDFDQSAYADNQYVMCVVVESTQLPELMGRYALVEARYVEYVEA
jgi:hypothetical protein